MEPGRPDGRRALVAADGPNQEQDSDLQAQAPSVLAATNCRLIVKLIIAFLLASILWVLAYRFINPPITFTMLGDVFAGRGATREWMPISEIDRDMVRAAIAAEDSKFCSHHGFDYQAIENAMQRNASGGRIRGGSTISQQTAKNAFLWQNGG